MTEPRTHDAGNKRPNKSRQCTAHVAKRTERHDSAVEGEHERDQWRRDEIRAEFAPPRIAPSAGDCCTAGFRVGLCPLWVISRHYLPPSRCPLYPQKRTSRPCLDMSAQKRTFGPNDVLRAGCSIALVKMAGL